jgi:hypothetical protein
VGTGRFSLKQFKAGAARRIEHGPHRAKENAMSAAPTPALEPDDEPVPAMQQILENPFLLLFIGVAMPTVLYIVWGVMEIVNIPVAK